MKQLSKHQNRPAISCFGLSAVLTCFALQCPSASLCQTNEIAADQAKPADIVVVGRHGEADAATETELDEDDIGDYAASSIRDLLKQISPLIDGTDDQPVVLVNGKRIADLRDISGYPPEALQRVDILGREAAGRYGFAPDKRIVNLVLKKKFSGLSAEASVSAPMAGGRDSETLQAQSVAIAEEKRWNVEASLSRDSMLLDSSRNVPSLPGAGSTFGNVLALGSEELDPSLSALAGEPVTQAAVPGAAANNHPTLADFLAGAGNLNPRDDGRFISLSPATKAASFNAGFNQPFGSWSVSLNLRAGRQASRQLLGLAIASFTLPTGSPFSPFSQDVLVERLLLAPGPLMATRASTSLGFSGSLGGNIGHAHAMLSMTYDRNESESRTERGFDLSEADLRISAGDPMLNPFGDVPVGPLDIDRTHGHNDTLSTQVTIGDKLFALPAGPILWTINGALTRAESETSFDDEAGSREDRQTSSQGDARLSLNVPLASRRVTPRGLLGDVNLQFSGGGSLATGTSLHTRFTGGLAWTPFPALSFNSNLGIEEEAPSAEQRDAPIIQTPNVRLYDYATGQLAEISQITGGNPALQRGSSRTLLIGGTVRPFGGRQLTLGIDYRRRDARGGIGGLPTLTPAIEAAFPERVQRDADGQLIAVDMRPINLARDLSENLRTRLTWSHPFGLSRSPTSTGAVPPGRAGTSGGPPRLGRGRGVGRIEFSINYGLQLRNALLIRNGLPLLDRLKGDGGGQSRHTLQLQTTVAKGGANLNFDLRWQSAYRTRASTGNNGSNDLHFKPAINAGLKLEFDLGRIAWFGHAAWLKATQLTFQIDNLLDKRLRVTRGDDTIPRGYTHDEVDPIGRLIKMSLRRRF